MKKESYPYKSGYIKLTPTSNGVEYYAEYHGEKLNGNSKTKTKAKQICEDWITFGGREPESFDVVNRDKLKGAPPGYNGSTGDDKEYHKPLHTGPGTSLTKTHYCPNCGKTVEDNEWQEGAQVCTNCFDEHPNTDWHKEHEKYDD